MKLKFSSTKSRSCVLGEPSELKMNSVHSDEFTIVLVTVHQDSNTLHSHFVLEESCGMYWISIKNKISNKLAETEADEEELKRSNKKVIEVERRL